MMKILTIIKPRTYSLCIKKFHQIINKSKPYILFRLEGDWSPPLSSPNCMQLLEDGSWITQRAGWSIQIIGEDNKCIESCSPEHKTLCFSRVVSKVVDIKF